MVASKNKKPGDLLYDVFNRATEVLGDLTTATATASKTASLASAKHLVKLQKASMKAGLGLVTRVQDYTEKALRGAIKDGKWLPEEGKDVVDEWADMMDGGVKEFSRVVDKSFDLVIKYIERLEKEAEKGNKTKAATGAKKTAAAKKSPAKKAPAKKASAKKAPAKKKSAKKNNDS